MNKDPPKDYNKMYLSELSLISYRSLEECTNILLLKLQQQQIEYAVLICHDKDKSTPHTHIYLRLPRARLVAQIVRWFRGVDEEGLLVNTFAQPVNTNYRDLLQYFLHRKNADKHQYNDDDLIYIGDVSDIDNESVDNSFTILTQLMNGVSLIELVRLYGKDFVYHYRNYKEIIQDLQTINVKIKNIY